MSILWNDVAPTEGTFNILQNERVHGTRYATHDEAHADLFDCIEIAPALGCA